MDYRQFVCVRAVWQVMDFTGQKLYKMKQNRGYKIEVTWKRESDKRKGKIFNAV